MEKRKMKKVQAGWYYDGRFTIVKRFNRRNIGWMLEDRLTGERRQFDTKKSAIKQAEKNLVYGEKK